MLQSSPVLLPDLEAERLETLRTYGILHALREPLFLEMTELAAALFSVPISLIALVAAGEVEYIATYGLPNLRSQPRTEAICSLAVQQRQAVVLADVAQARLLPPEAAAAAQAKNLRFYAGAPLCMPNRHCIGTLCLIGRQPRPFSAPEQQVLEQLAQLVGRLIAVRRSCLADPAKGEAYWSLLHAELTQEVRTLLAWVRHAIGYVGAHVPVPADVLEPANQQFNDFRWRLTDYYPGPL